MRSNAYILSIICLCGCSKDELTKPTAVEFEFQMNTEINDGKFLQFEQGTLEFNSITFDGTREAGDDVFFIANYDSGVHVELETKTSSEKIDFDIPQGVYNRIQVGITRESMMSNPGITFKGIYKSAKKKDLPVIIEFDFEEGIEIDATSDNGSNTIVLNKDLGSTAEVTIDPVFMFQLVNSRSLESAKITEIDGEEIIIISKDLNTKIFNKLIDRLEKSTAVVFRE